MGNCNPPSVATPLATIDKKLFPGRSRRGFVQSMPNKPTKFDIKFWMLCDVKTFYVLRAMPYVGKEDRPRVDVAEHVVRRLMKPYHKTRQNVAIDNYITSLTTAENLLLQNIAMAGALPKNKREIPFNLHVDTLHSSRFLFSQKDGIMILYYEAKPKKDVFLLSSSHTIPVIDDSDSKKNPEAILR